MQRIKGELGGISPLLQELLGAGCNCTAQLHGFAALEPLICEENLDPSRRYRLVEKLLSKNSWVPGIPGHSK